MLSPLLVFYCTLIEATTSEMKYTSAAQNDAPICCKVNFAVGFCVLRKIFTSLITFSMFLNVLQESTSSLFLSYLHVCSTVFILLTAFLDLYCVSLADHRYQRPVDSREFVWFLQELCAYKNLHCPGWSVPNAQNKIHLFEGVCSVLFRTESLCKYYTGVRKGKIV